MAAQKRGLFAETTLCIWKPGSGNRASLSPPPPPSAPPPHHHHQVALAIGQAPYQGPKYAAQLSHTPCDKKL